jgi:hypothetical protein
MSETGHPADDKGEELGSRGIPRSRQSRYLIFVSSTLSLLSNGLTTSSGHKVNSICNALRTLLESQDLVKYIETILTTHVCKQPADYESGLRLLLQLQGTSPRFTLICLADP